jgi:hypothetical protein
MDGSLSAWRVAMDGWRLALTAAARMPRLLVSTLVMTLALALLFAYAHARGTNVGEAVLAYLLQFCISALVCASSAIAVHRFVLLREVADRYIWSLPRQVWRFCTWLVIIQLITLPGEVITLASANHPGTVTTFITSVAGIVELIITLRTMLLFPAIAVEAINNTVGNAWHDSKGHTWFLFRVMLCLIVPLLPLLISVPLLPWSQPWVLVVITQFSITPMIWAGAAAASLAYRAFGFTLAGA